MPGTKQRLGAFLFAALSVALTLRFGLPLLLETESVAESLSSQQPRSAARVEQVRAPQANNGTQKHKSLPFEPGSELNGDTTSAAAEQPVAPAGVQKVSRKPESESESGVDDPNARRRYRVRWGSAGLCGGEKNNKLEERAAMLARFRRVPEPDLDIVADDGVNAYGVAATVASVRRGLSVIEPWYSPPASPPPVVIYKDVEQLLSGACVSGFAVAYYDGTLHVTPDPRLGPGQLAESVMHELVHHALLTRGVREPMWLQEGLAMNVAAESWWQEPTLGLVTWAKGSHLPFSAMVKAFPHTADEQFALAAYFQSLAMVEAVIRAGGIKRIQAVVEALAQHQVDPAAAYAWGLGGANESEQEIRWRDAVESLDTLAD